MPPARTTFPLGFQGVSRILEKKIIIFITNGTTVCIIYVFCEDAKRPSNLIREDAKRPSDPNPTSPLLFYVTIKIKCPFLTCHPQKMPRNKIYPIKYLFPGFRILSYFILLNEAQQKSDGIYFSLLPF